MEYVKNSYDCLTNEAIDILKFMDYIHLSPFLFIIRFIDLKGRITKRERGEDRERDLPHTGSFLNGHSCLGQVSPKPAATNSV